MTLLSDRLKEAGANTAEARLMALACDALRESDGSVASASIVLWNKLKAESWVARDVWLLPYLHDRKRDMRGNVAAHSEPERPAARPRPHLVSHERKARVEKVIAKAVEAIKFNYLTADGRDWATVGAHELDGMARDGTLAKAVKDKLGVLTNSQRFKTIGELMNAESFERARAEAA